MPDELQPSLFNILRDDMRALGDRLDRLVTAEAFATERKRVDEKTADLGADIAQERTDRELAVKDLQGQITTAAADAKEAQQTQQNRKVTLQQGILIAIVGVLGSGVVGLAVIIVQNAAHLG